MKTLLRSPIAITILLGTILPSALIVLLPLINPSLDLSIYYRPTDVSLIPQTDSSLFEQWLISIVAFGIKQIYEIMALIIIIKLWRNPDSIATDIRRGMAAFLIGELSCAFNYLLFKENSLAMEYIHVFGMLVGFGLITHAFLAMIDSRLIKYSDRDKKCALLFFCKYCYKNHPVSCTARQIYQFAIPGLLLLCLLPASGELGGYFITSNILGTEAVFGHSLAQQVMETIIFPSAAAIFFLATLIILIRNKEEGLVNAKKMLSAGIGALGFSLMRFTIFWSFKSSPLWADTWEELTEFIFVSFMLYLVFLSFRDRAPAKVEQQ